MVNYKPMVQEVTAELQGLGSVPFSGYAIVVRSKGLPPPQEEALMRYASDVWAINNVQWSARPQMHRPHSLPREGFSGLMVDISDMFSDTIDTASDIARIPVGIVGGVVSLGREMSIDPALEIMVGTPTEIATRTQHYMAQTGYNPYDATLEAGDIAGIKKLY